MGRVAGVGALLTTVLLLLYVGSVGALASTGAATAATGEDSQNVCQPGVLTVAPATATTPKTITCTITQPVPSNSGQTNNAVCTEFSSTPAVVEICNITQTNSRGDNLAVVLQTADQQGGRMQRATQRANVTQTNTFDGNIAGVSQSVKQSTLALGDQTQFSDQGFHHFAFPPITPGPGVTILQNNNTGENLIALSQFASQDQETSSHTALQDQKAGQAAKLDQLHTPVNAGLSRSVIVQNPSQDQDGPVAANQKQLVDPHCCNTFEGSSARIDLTQNVVQMAHTLAKQDAANEAHCHVTPTTAGTCNVKETINQNGALIRTTCSNAICDRAQQCDNGTCVQVTCTIFNTETGSFCSFGPPFGGGLGLRLGRTSGPLWAARSMTLQTRGRPILA